MAARPAVPGSGTEGIPPRRGADPDPRRSDPRGRADPGTCPARARRLRRRVPDRSRPADRCARRRRSAAARGARGPRPAVPVRGRPAERHHPGARPPRRRTASARGDLPRAGRRGDPRPRGAGGDPGLAVARGIAHRSGGRRLDPRDRGGVPGLAPPRGRLLDARPLVPTLPDRGRRRARRRPGARRRAPGRDRAGDLRGPAERGQGLRRRAVPERRPHGDAVDEPGRLGLPVAVAVTERVADAAAGDRAPHRRRLGGRAKHGADRHDDGRQPAIPSARRSRSCRSRGTWSTPRSRRAGSSAPRSTGWSPGSATTPRTSPATTGTARRCWPTHSGRCSASTSTTTPRSTWAASSRPSTRSTASTSTSTTRCATRAYNEYGYGNAGYSIGAGHHHMNGNQALAYARIRKSAGESDFTRAARQQQVVVALKDKVVRGGFLDDPIGLLNAVGNTVKTNIPPSVVRQLAPLATEIGSEGHLPGGRRAPARPVRVRLSGLDPAPGLRQDRRARRGDVHARSARGRRAATWRRRRRRWPRARPSRPRSCYTPARSRSPSRSRRRSRPQADAKPKPSHRRHRRRPRPRRRPEPAPALNRQGGGGTLVPAHARSRPALVPCARSLQPAP